jgi:hypothetical protein
MPDLFWKIAAVPSIWSHPNILCPSQAQVLHNLSTGESTAKPRVGAAGDGQMPLWLLFDHLNLKLHSSLRAALLKARRPDRTSCSSRAS